ncbi:PspC domain-containing protein [Stygiobacter electus]|uniref:PspC domain-containing protein n=1 Tax=Stygiobacter electus TaxID=3032292 RepID=A0AAE3NXD8_9BACT|nr:PspC domain-containing protein [Stygiobacter electus]MDF1610529.1 PspC domain-containing protein [Stygiobacter electus]
MKEKLYRSRKQKIIAGVAGGLSDYFNIDPVIIRILFVVLSILHGSGILIYIILWIAIPEEPFDVAYNINNQSEPNNTNTNDIPPTKNSYSPRFITGLILVFIGVAFLLNNLIPSFDFSDIFPYILILIGVLLISNSFKK